MIHIAFAHWNALNVATFRGALEWLDDTEHQYSSRFRDHIFRSEWQGGRILLRWLLSRITHRDPAQWRFKKEPSGRLTISKEISFGYSVSLSRAPGIAVAAIASGFPVGVDVEAVNAAGVAEDVLTDTERVNAAQNPVALTSFWCMREAVAKGCGAGLAWAMEPQCFQSESRYIDPSGNTWSAIRIFLPSGWTGAVAAPGIKPEVVLIDAFASGFP